MPRLPLILAILSAFLDSSVGLSAERNACIDLSKLSYDQQMTIPADAQELSQVVDLTGVFRDDDVLTCEVKETNHNVIDCVIDEDKKSLKIVAKSPGTFIVSVKAKSTGNGIDQEDHNGCTPDDSVPFTISVRKNSPPERKETIGKHRSTANKGEFTLKLDEYFTDKDGDKLDYESKVIGGVQDERLVRTLVVSNTNELYVLYNERPRNVTINVTATDGVDSVSQELQLEITPSSLSSPSDFPGKLHWDDPGGKQTGHFYADMFAGFEGTTVSEIESKATPRLEFYGYYAADLPRYKLHLSGNLLLTNTEENSGQDGQEPGDGTTKEIQSAIAGNLNVMFPWNEPKNSHDVIGGFILSHGLKRAQGGGNFIKEYYGGYRLAHSQVQYMEILYGKSEALSGNRVKLRGQIPFKNTFLIGLSLNFGVRNSPPEGDTVLFYVTWRTGLLSDFIKLPEN